MTSPRACAHGANPATRPPCISLISWLAVGGTGPPPTLASFCLMASERKAAYREEQAYKEARKAASTGFQEKWSAAGLTKRERPPNRRELMRLYGPTSTAHRRADEGAGEKRHDSNGAACNNDDGGGGGAGNEESNYGNNGC
ncbi:hypothetical protein F4679DRAFT_475000 [Xylaria curta]|nr:hypothetical protein F4679DRAFT_475000 [Xylaria curta]